MNGLLPIGANVFRFFYALGNRLNIIPLPPRVVNGYVYIPVSYTHLDVYKRQP